ncbi:MAG: hypothetical protein KJ952_02325 [Candidatus Omnitrophica bacterium]|nr:hypothetical protein [Candidatus Omnitrophota bacterium]
MKRIQAFLTLGFLFIFLLCIGFFVQKENEKKARIETENMLMVSVKERLRLKAEFERRIVEYEEKIKYLFAQVEKETKINSMLIANLKRRKARFEVASNKDEKQITLEKIVIKSVPDVKGRVLMVDEENNLVIINLGESNDIRIGDRFSVYREDYFVGDIEIIRLQNSLSAGEILSEKENLNIAVNDMVSLF